MAPKRYQRWSNARIQRRFSDVIRGQRKDITKTIALYSNEYQVIVNLTLYRQLFHNYKTIPSRSEDRRRRGHIGQREARRTHIDNSSWT